MKLRHISFVLFLAATTAFAADNNAPGFDEVYGLLRENLGGMSKSELDQAAVKGLIDQLQGRVVLGKAPDARPSAALSKSALFDNSFAYIRLGAIGGDVGEKVASAYGQFNATNQAKIKGLVLDLRFAGGLDYAAAAKVADQFVNSDAPLLDWGSGSALATRKTNTISVPVAVLINSKTTGAAEALAGMLREANVGLLIGSPTAGHAGTFKEFTLSNGEKLQIVTTPVKLGNGKPVSDVKPDISVQVSPADELAFLEDAYKTAPETAGAKASNSETNLPSSSITNLPPHRRLNEAELVRIQREGGDLDSEPGAHPSKEDSAKPIVSDPALSRALDLLKGLAVVHPARPG